MLFQASKFGVLCYSSPRKLFLLRAASSGLSEPAAAPFHCAVGVYPSVCSSLCRYLLHAHLPHQTCEGKHPGGSL